LASTRDLGVISGDIAGVSVANGKVILTGTSRDSGLSAGTTTNANSGGKDVFVAALSTDLTAVDRRPADLVRHARATTRAADVKVHDGKVWITGITGKSATATGHRSDQGLSGPARSPDRRRRIRKELDRVTATRRKPATLAVASNGASVLDRLGLPQGEIDQSDSKFLTAATSLRVGDRFYISPPTAAGRRP
jgi:hypothetical protein